MTDPVTLDNLREMTGGDKALEKELFDVYITSCEDCLNALKASTEEGKEEEWRTQAHAWKGMSLNLGAETLGNLCAQAQTDNLVPADKKREMLAGIEEEFGRVKAFLTSI